MARRGVLIATAAVCVALALVAAGVVRGAAAAAAPTAVSCSNPVQLGMEGPFTGPVASIGDDRDEAHAENGKRGAGVVDGEHAGGEADDEPNRRKAPRLIVRLKRQFTRQRHRCGPRDSSAMYEIAQLDTLCLSSRTILGIGLNGA